MIISSTRSAHLALLLLPYVSAVWPFQQKQFTPEALIDAGPLGLDGVDGRVVAVGDWNGDKHTDLFVVSSDSKLLQVYTWNRDLFRYFPAAEHRAASHIVNVIPGDFNQDGRLDVLLMYGGEKNGWWGGEADTLGMEVLLGEEGGDFGEKWQVPASSAQQPLVFDANGSLRPSLLGHAHPDGASKSTGWKAWLNDGAGLQLSTPPFEHPEQACVLANPHSSAFIDIDGDCVPDLVLHCSKPKSGRHMIQIWLNKGSKGYQLSNSYDLSKGAGPLSFADMNRDGTIDIIFPVCSKVSSSGQGSDCIINIAYNRQIPVCSSEGSDMNKDGSLRCRGWGELCSSDPNYSLKFDGGSSPELYSTALSTIFGREVSLLLNPPSQPHLPLPLRAGDYNVDGYPDLLITVVDPTAKASSGVFGSKEGSQAHILRNVPCARGLPGCDDGNQERTFVVGEGKGWEALDDVWDVTGASWIDVDDDGSLDILVQRSGSQGAGTVTFVQNNFYNDAFFLKAQVLNGACDGDCVPAGGGAKYSPTGASYSGATYKLTVLDTLGRRRAQAVGQLPQSTYQTLDLPYAYIGLGRTNNYIERLTVGASLTINNITDLDSIIPNSHLIINPPHPVSKPDTGPVQNRPLEWRTELYLHPGDWVPYVAAAVLGTVIILAGVVMGLNEREKKEDEMERRRALHAINFQAL